MTTNHHGHDDGEAVVLATVNIYGGGVAGLTAAHELVKRGFKVRVFEKEQGADARGKTGMALGGMARTQYVSTPRLASPRWWIDNRDQRWPCRLATPDESARDLRLEIRFEQGTAQITDESKEALRAVVPALTSPPLGQYCIAVTAVPPPDALAPERDAPTLSEERAGAVVLFLTTGTPAVNPARVHVVVPRLPGSSSSGTPLQDGGVIVSIEETVLPGEHGFRFFPAYYRHVFDTMLDTPLYDATGLQTGRTVYDNVVSTPSQAYATYTARPFVIPRSQTEAGAANQETQNELSLGYSSSDISQMSLRMLRLMTLCPARRADLEEISWWEYLTGYSPVTGQSLYRYTDAFTRNVIFSGKVLIAADTNWGDARTNGDTCIQLSLGAAASSSKVDGTLNAPTTEAWFDPWRTHLRTLGVELVQGELLPLRLDPEGALVVTVNQGELEQPAPPADYHVVATDVVTAQQLTEQLPAVGVPRMLRGYTTRVPEVAGAQGTIRRDPYTQIGIKPWDRLQTLSGIQYFFAGEFKGCLGHYYFIDAEWALTSINSQGVWAKQRSFNVDGYNAVLSIDIGDWSSRSKDPAIRDRSAWHCSRDEIAREVWRQVETSLAHIGAPLPEGTPAERRVATLPQPVWYHIDDNIVFEPGSSADSRPSGERPARNLTPFLIPMKQDWKWRPGADPWDPSIGSAHGPRSAPEPGVWQAAHGGYWVHFGALVFTGNYNRTFTRLTTMESANESGRHAVNAILDHYLERPEAEARRRAIYERLVRPETAPEPTTARPPAPPPTTLDAETLIRTSFIGDYCGIWDPEKNELGAFDAIRRLDQLLFDLGQPPLWDSLGIEVLPALRSHLGQPFGERQAISALLGALAAGTHPVTPQGLAEAEQMVRTAIERWAAQAGLVSPKA